MTICMYIHTTMEIWLKQSYINYSPVGLSGIELGSSLINRVVQELRTKEFPFLEDFVTLSPIPGFRKWLESHLNQNIPEGMYGIMCHYNEYLMYSIIATETCKISPDELQSLTRFYDSKNEHYLSTLQVLYRHTYIHTYIYTYIHIYINMYIHT